ncbi:MAG: 4Fe-4S binding protein [Desulfitobacterium hafniense]|nr:4Fe-4S binding protein [Desulfitobacterium hafniense]
MEKSAQRQRIRKALILISFLFFPVSLYYFSPALIIEGAAKGIAVGSFIVFSLQLITSLLLGRAFCGWMCPGAGLQEACFSIKNKHVRENKLRLIKYFIWVPWISLIAWLAIKKGGFNLIEPLYGTTSGISLSDLQSFIIYYIVVGLITLTAFLFGKRAFCHYLCWMAPFMVIGQIIREKLRLPGLRLKANSHNCSSCQKCNSVCPMSLNVHGMVKSNSMSNVDCILCGTCIDSCSNKALSYRLFRY